MFVTSLLPAGQVIVGSQNPKTLGWVLGASGRSSRWTHLCPSVYAAVFPKLGPASAQASILPRPQTSNPQSKPVGPAQALLPTPGTPGPEGTGQWPPWAQGDFVYGAHFTSTGSCTAAILPQSSCQQRGAAFTPPANFPSSSFGHVPVPPRSRGCVEVDRGPEGD